MNKLNYIRIFVFILFIPIQPQIFTDEINPILQLDTGSHKAMIRKIITTSDKKYIITASDDKTIRIYDIKTQKEVRKILGNIGDNHEDKIFAIALTPDDKYLAVGGFFTSYYKDGGVIRFYDYKTGKIIGILHAHNSIVTDLYFSADGRYLASCSYDKSVKVWDVEKVIANISKKEIKKSESILPKSIFEEQDRDIMGVRIFKHNNDYRIVSVSYDSSVFLYSLNKKKIIAGYYHDDMVESVAIFAPQNKSVMSFLIATAGYDKKINLYNKDLKLIKSITSETRPTGLSFSDDGRFLLAGMNNFPYHCNVYDVHDKLKKISTFYKQNNTTMAVTFLKDNLVATGGGANHEIYLWDALTGKEKGHIVGIGKCIWAVGIRGNKIAFGQYWYGGDTHTNTTKLEKTFSLEDFSINSLTSSNDKIGNFNRISTTYQDYYLTHTKGGDYNYDDAILVLKKGEKEIFKIIRDSVNGLEHTTYGFTENGYIVSGGANGQLNLLDLSGNKIAQFVGHTGVIWGIATEKNILVSGSNDQTIKIWDLNNIEKNKFVNYEWFDNSWKDFVEKYYPFLDIKKTDDVEKLYYNLLRDYGKEEANKLLKKQKIFPKVTIFISTDEKYLVWTHDYYYTGDKELFAHIGWHINQGYDKEAKFYPFEQFDLKFNRPDIVLKKLGLVDSFIIKAYYRMYKNRLKKMGFTEDALSGKIHIPEVSIESNVKEGITDSGMAVIKINAVDSLFTLDRINIFINNVPIYGIEGISIKGKNLKKYTTTIPIKLIYGDNKVQVSVLNSDGAESLKETLNIFCNKEYVKPNLYLATVGVSKYKDDRWNLTYADKDAKDLIKIYRQQEGKLFDNVFVLSLNNQKATKRNIEKIKNFFNQSTIDDMVILFISGHGIRDEKGEYYFATYDINFDHPSKKGLMFNELESFFDKIPNLKKVFLMDTCFSGEANSYDYEFKTKSTSKNGKVRGRPFAQEMEIQKTTKKDADKKKEKITIKKQQIDKNQLLMLKKDLFSTIKNTTGTTVITSSSGAEYSYEGIDLNGKQIENGVFTYCFISGVLNNNSDTNNDNKIQVSEIMKWVYDSVQRITEGRQTPSTRKGNIEFDFVIY